ncbi:sSU ribosomal protein S30P / sigma 54 modulation protein [Clostridium sp. CAG:1000]|jgi:putative sigma-54 modulation protein|nr:sSU ribosomal protein S30P / sigma 54 modulation protein [Clostridium sp. CAG:1000]
MKYNIRGNKIDVTEAISDYIKNKVSKLEKYLDDNDEVEAKAIVSAKGHNQKVEITIWSGKYNIRAEVVNPDLYSAIDLVIDKLERQFKKYRGKLNIKRAKEEYISEIDELLEEEEQKIVRRKVVYLKPIDEEEAITQMELLGHSFFVFKNVETGKINVVYKRSDSDYGLIEAN